MVFGLFEPNVPTITVEEVQKAVTNNENVTVLDVRTTEECMRRRIKKSINVPLDEIEKRIASVIPEKKQKIYVYCLSGSRSTMAVVTMQKLGYTNVFSMKNGMLGWRVKKYAEER